MPLLHYPQYCPASHSVPKLPPWVHPARRNPERRAGGLPLEFELATRSFSAGRLSPKCSTSSWGGGVATSPLTPLSAGALNQSASALDLRRLASYPVCLWRGAGSCSLFEKT